mgnify:CR=1 FL=1
MRRLIARNAAADSENRIHDDAAARRLGFAGALVPGVTTYGLVVPAIVEALGEGWLERGGATLRLLRPVYDGETIVLRETPAAGGMEIVVEGEGGDRRATVACVAAHGEVSPDLRDFPEASLPSPPPLATRAALEGARVLGSIPLDSPEAAIDLAAAVVGAGNEIIARNFTLGPWMHVATDVAHFAATRAGDAVSARGRVAALYECNGHEYVEADILVLAANRPLARLRHTAIWRLGGGGMRQAPK